MTTTRFREGLTAGLRAAATGLLELDGSSGIEVPFTDHRDRDGRIVVKIDRPAEREPIEIPDIVYAQVAPGGDHLRWAHTPEGLEALLAEPGSDRREIARFDRVATPNRDEGTTRPVSDEGRLTPAMLEELVTRVAERVRQTAPSWDPADDDERKVWRAGGDMTALAGPPEYEPLHARQERETFRALAEILEPFATYEEDDIARGVVLPYLVAKAAVEAMRHATESVSLTARCQAAERQRDEAVARADATLAKMDQRRAGSRMDVEWRASGAGELSPSAWVDDADDARAAIDAHRAILEREGRGGESVLESRTITVGPPERAAADRGIG